MQIHLRLLFIVILGALALLWGCATGPASGLGEARQALLGSYRTTVFEVTFKGQLSGGSLKLCFGAQAQHCPFTLSQPNKPCAGFSACCKGLTHTTCTFKDSQRYDAFGVQHPDMYDHITLKKPLGPPIFLHQIKLAVGEQQPSRVMLNETFVPGRSISSSAPLSLASELLAHKKKLLCEVANGTSCSAQTATLWYDQQPDIVKSAALDANKPSIMLKYSLSRAMQFTQILDDPGADPDAFDWAFRNLYASCGETAGWQMLRALGIGHFSSIVDRCDNNSSFDNFGDCAPYNAGASPEPYGVKTIRPELGWKQNNRLAKLQFNSDRTAFRPSKARRILPHRGECKPNPGATNTTPCSIRSYPTWSTSFVGYTPKAGDLIFRHDRCKEAQGQTGMGHVSMLVSDRIDLDTTGNDKIWVRVFEGGSSIPALNKRAFYIYAKCGSYSGCTCPKNDYRFDYYIGITAP